MKSTKELLEILNTTDECSQIEAKKGRAIDKSIMESICAFSNEPGLGGGTVVLGVERVEQSLFPEYSVTGIENSDQLQSDLSTQCATIFNTPVRPSIEVEDVSGLLVMKIEIEELPDSQKPVYFKNVGLPKGAFRRIGPTDQRCSDDDLNIFYDNNETYDSSVVKGSSWDDVDELAIDQYRKLRQKVNPGAEELSFDDQDLLLALNCIQKEQGQIKLTVAGLHLFGSKMALRRLAPSCRVDYIRVPGNEWVENPDDRFTTVDLRGSLLLTISRIYSSVADDLPKGFLLPEGEIQAQSTGLPGRVLREALVNALMHRSYREHEPIQIIRYSNRLEIRNPGFSLKPEDALGEPGSKQRNPFIAAVFHETNLAETKGSGIRTMRNLMQQSGMVLPTFESEHGKNMFTARLLLHHFLSESDLEWLAKFDQHDLNNDQKLALVFVREMGAIDNVTYRQIAGVDVLKASGELRQLKSLSLLEAKGKGRATYYIAGSSLLSAPPGPEEESTDIQEDPGLSAPPQGLSAPPLDPSAPPIYIQDMIDGLGQRSNPEDVQAIVVKLCQWKPLKSSELAKILKKSEKHVLRSYLQPLKEKGAIRFTIPDMENHPDQAYTAD